MAEMADITVGKTYAIHGILKTVADYVGRNGAAYELTFQRDGLNYPDTWKCWDAGALPGIKDFLGKHVSLQVTCERVKKDKTDDGQHGSYWWSVVGYGSTVTKPEPTADTESPFDDIPPAKAPLPDMPRSFPADTQRRSIERQVSAKLAVETAKWLIESQGFGDKGDMVDQFCALVGEVTDKFYAIISKPEKEDADEVPVADNG